MASQLPVKDELTHGFTVPTFIQLAVIRRVLCEYFVHSNNNSAPSSNMIEALVCTCDMNEAQQKHACQILIPLISGGIKKYMKEYYNDEEASLMVVNIVYERIIKGKLGNIYQDVISYHDHTEKNDNYNYNEKNINENKTFQYLVFNTSDLMCLIFQWFGIKYENFNNKEYTYGYDLHCCSLVSFHWLFHVWHSNSSYFTDLTHYILSAVAAKKVNRQRIWQRFSSSKSVQIDVEEFDIKQYTTGHDNNNDIVVSILNKVGLFNKVDKIVGYISGQYFNILTAIVSTILQKSKNKIKYFAIQFNPELKKEKNLVVQKIFLPKAEKIYMTGVYYAIKWTFKCKYLTFYDDTHDFDLGYSMYRNLIPFTSITKEMCQYIIDNCDCSGITSLEFERVKFPFLDNNKNNDEFRKLLQPIIVENNCIVDVMSNILNYKKIEIKNGDIDQNGLYTGEETFGDSKWYLSRKLLASGRAQFVQYDRDGDNKLNVREAWQFFQMAKMDTKSLQAAWKMMVTQHDDPQLPRDGLSLIQFYSMFHYTLAIRRHGMKFEQCPKTIPPPIQFNVIRMYLKSAQEINQMKDKTIEMPIGHPSMVETVVREDKLRIH